MTREKQMRRMPTGKPKTTCEQGDQYLHVLKVADRHVRSFGPWDIDILFNFHIFIRNKKY